MPANLAVTFIQCSTPEEGTTIVEGAYATTITTSSSPYSIIVASGNIENSNDSTGISGPGDLLHKKWNLSDRPESYLQVNEILKKTLNNHHRLESIGHSSL